MEAILTRAGCFLAIILLGIVLRAVGFFKEGDFRVLSQITLKITLPAAVVVNFSQMQLNTGMLTICLMGIGCGVVYILSALVLNIGTNRNQRAFDVLNLPGYNIGLFAMPFIQSFMGSTGAVITSLFDTGNAVICLGGSYGIASGIKEGKGFSLLQVLKALVTSVPFLAYVIMIVLNLLNIYLPAAVVNLADIIKSANTFMAMLMIGVGFRLKISWQSLGQILKIVLVRYSIAAGLAAAFYFLLPFDLVTRQTLVLLAFSPIGAATPAFTGQLKGDVGLSSAVNSICIICSIVIMTALLTVML